MSNKYIPVEGHEDLVRDKNSGAIISINNSELSKRQTLRKMKSKERDRLTSLENDINEIKSLLSKLIEKS